MGGQRDLGDGLQALISKNILKVMLARRKPSPSWPNFGFRMITGMFEIPAALSFFAGALRHYGHLPFPFSTE